MTFNSFEYVFFLVVVLMVYHLLLRRCAQNLVLLAASYWFYAAWDARFLTLIWISTAVDYMVGLRLPANGTSVSSAVRRGWLALSLVTNLGMLGFFKYYGFFVDSAADLLGGFGLSVSTSTLRIVLRSESRFYTFQTLSYTIDIWRRRLEPTRNLVDFALFVAFFPQLVAGPIERASRLLPQIQRDRRVTGDDVSGLQGLGRLGTGDVAALLPVLVLWLLVLLITCHNTGVTTNSRSSPGPPPSGAPSPAPPSSC